MKSINLNKHSWHEDQVVILVWIIFKYTIFNNKSRKSLVIFILIFLFFKTKFYVSKFYFYIQTDEDWEKISNMIAGRTPENCKFEWLYL